ncbi:phosphoribosylglycinamide formyltransferase [Oceanobacter antarcticus]|jgi:phosphoribosylglycinamide formyltransferase-1|uniref:Phosphoribosylglycinamide formyltransferase n=1 Tax=Oceanobacter antarcticus TaxID=3133425 RepID=A0ABW8NLL1_9GAMM
MMTDSALDQPRIVILISGTGSNMMAIADAVQSGDIDAMVAGVVSNRPDAAGMQHARDREIPAILVDHQQFSSREEFDANLMRAIDDLAPDLIVLAGFMRILTSDFVRHYRGRMINIHPSLLPLYQGLNTHQRAIDAGDSEHGVSVHFVTEELDGGPVIAQAVVTIDTGETAASLQHKVQIQEHILYPIIVKWCTQGRLAMTDQGVTLDSKLLPPSGLRLTAQP